MAKVDLTEADKANVLGRTSYTTYAVYEAYIAFSVYPNTSQKLVDATAVAATNAIAMHVEET